MDPELDAGRIEQEQETEHPERSALELPRQAAEAEARGHEGLALPADALRAQAIEQAPFARVQICAAEWCNAAQLPDKFREAIEQELLKERTVQQQDLLNGLLRACPIALQLRVQERLNVDLCNNLSPQLAAIEQHAMLLGLSYFYSKLVDTDFFWAARLARFYEGEREHQDELSAAITRAYAAMAGEEQSLLKAELADQLRNVNSIPETAALCGMTAVKFHLNEALPASFWERFLDFVRAPLFGAPAGWKSLDGDLSRAEVAFLRKLASAPSKDRPLPDDDDNPKMVEWRAQLEFVSERPMSDADKVQRLHWLMKTVPGSISGADFVYLMQRMPKASGVSESCVCDGLLRELNSTLSCNWKAESCEACDIAIVWEALRRVDRQRLGDRTEFSYGMERALCIVEASRSYLQNKDRFVRDVQQLLVLRHQRLLQGATPASETEGRGGIITS